MRGKCSPKQGNNKAVAGMDIHKVDKLNEEPHLSGAYIRNLVKQLTSTRSKDALSAEIDQQPEEHPVDDNGGGGGNEESSSSLQPPPPPPPPPGPPPQPQHKKQVRRRLHTSKPYQERLLNMAEARREIVTALKFHRATMKQQQQPPEIQETHQMKSKSKRNSRVSPPNHNNHLSSASASASASGFNSCPFSHPYPYYYNPWLLSSSITPPPLFQENNLHQLPLPNQPLGLNLNFQHFNIDNKIVFSNYTNTSPSCSSSPPTTTTTTTNQQVLIPMNNYDEVGFHYAMDDKELAEIRSIGEQHQIEWNDTMNLVNSAWWSKFLNSMETDNPQQQPFDDENVGFLPSWINDSNETLLEDYCSDDYMKDAALPCMEIEEIEGIEGDWLSS